MLAPVILILLLVLYLYLKPVPSASVLQEAGLSSCAPFFAHDGLLTYWLERAADGFAKSHTGACEEGLAQLRTASVKASAAAHELMFKAPSDRHTQQRMQQGYDMMAAQLAALQTDIKQRCRLPPSPHDNLNVWDKYIETLTPR